MFLNQRNRQRHSADSSSVFHSDRRIPRPPIPPSSKHLEAGQDVSGLVRAGAESAPGHTLVSRQMADGIGREFRKCHTRSGLPPPVTPSGLRVNSRLSRPKVKAGGVLALLLVWVVTFEMDGGSTAFLLAHVPPFPRPPSPSPLHFPPFLLPFWFIHQPPFHSTPHPSSLQCQRLFIPLPHRRYTRRRRHRRARSTAQIKEGGG